MSTGGLGMKIRAGGAYVTLGVNDRLGSGLLMAERKLQAFGQKVGAMGAKMATASLAMLGPQAAAAKTFAGFESQMLKVKAIITPTVEEYTALWNEAKRLGAETQFTASDAARGMATLAQANFKANQILAAMLPILDLAAAGEMDVAEASDIAAQIMNSMNISANDVGTAIDVLTKATQTANTDLRDLGHAFTYAGAIASSAGASFEEATVFLQMMSNAGIKADMAGTTLRGALLALTSPSDMARERLTELGVDVDDLEGNFVSLSEVIRQFETKMGDKGTAERMRFLGDIFDNRQASGFAKAVANGAEMFKQMEKSLYNSTGSARKFANTIMSGLGGSWDFLTSAFEGLQISIGTISNDFFQGFLAGLTDAVGKLMEFVELNKEMIPNLILAGGLIGMLGVSFVGLSFTISTISTIISPIIFLISTFIGTLASLGTALVTFWWALPALAFAAWVAFFEFDYNFGVSVQGITKWLEWMKYSFTQTFDALKNAVKAGDFALAFKVVLTGFKLMFASTMNEVSKMFGTTIQGMVSGTMRMLKETMETITSWRADYARSDYWLRVSQPWATDKDLVDAQNNRNRMEEQHNFWRNFNPEKIGQNVASALDTSSIAWELERLRQEAEDAAAAAEAQRNKQPALGASREMPELRTPDGIIFDPEALKLEDASAKLKEAYSFAATGSYGGQFLNRMNPGAKTVQDKIAANTAKMVEQQKLTNERLDNLEPMAFAP